MANFSGVIDAMLSVAKAAAPVIGHGAPEAVALGERVVEMIDHAKSTFGTEMGEMRDLVAQREAIEQRIREHVDSTAANLRG